MTPSACSAGTPGWREGDRPDPIRGPTSWDSACAASPTGRGGAVDLLEHGRHGAQLHGPVADVRRAVHRGAHLWRKGRQALEASPRLRRPGDVPVHRRAAGALEHRPHGRDPALRGGRGYVPEVMQKVRAEEDAGRLVVEVT